MDWLAAIVLTVLLAVVIWRVVARRDGRGALSVRPPAPVEEMGYGAQRWERELSLWRGTLRRLEIQARRQDPIPEGLAQQMEEARRRIAEAERQLAGRD